LHVDDAASIVIMFLVQFVHPVAMAEHQKLANVILRERKDNFVLFFVISCNLSVFVQKDQSELQ
jgi:hypothetical protein